MHNKCLRVFPLSQPSSRDMDYPLWDVLYLKYKNVKKGTTQIAISLAGSHQKGGVVHMGKLSWAKLTWGSDYLGGRCGGVLPWSSWSRGKNNERKQVDLVDLWGHPFSTYAPGGCGKVSSQCIHPILNVSLFLYQMREGVNIVR